MVTHTPDQQTKEAVSSAFRRARTVATGVAAYAVLLKAGDFKNEEKKARSIIAAGIEDLTTQLVALKEEMSALDSPELMSHVDALQTLAATLGSSTETRGNWNRVHQIVMDLQSLKSELEAHNVLIAGIEPKEAPAGATEDTAPVTHAAKPDLGARIQEAFAGIGSCALFLVVAVVTAVVAIAIIKWAFGIVF